jgi:hypothetical protein
MLAVGIQWINASAEDTWFFVQLGRSSVIERGCPEFKLCHVGRSFQILPFLGLKQTEPAPWSRLISEALVCRFLSLFLRFSYSCFAKRRSRLLLFARCSRSEILGYARACLGLNLHLKLAISHFAFPAAKVLDFIRLFHTVRAMRYTLWSYFLHFLLFRCANVIEWISEFQFPGEVKQS